MLALLVFRYGYHIPLPNFCMHEAKKKTQQNQKQKQKQNKTKTKKANPPKQKQHFQAFGIVVIGLRVTSVAWLWVESFLALISVGFSGLQTQSHLAQGLLSLSIVTWDLTHINSYTD